MNPNNSLLIPLILLLLLQICSSTSNHTILQFNDTIKDGDVLVSDHGNFTLGFFSLPENPANRYLGIWFSRIPEKSLETVVWLANRDNPINDSSGVLSINSQGNLILHANNASFPVWSSNVSVSPPYNSAAKMLDSGSLVLSQQDTNAVLWQSIDHPTHVMLPFTKLGINRRTGINWFLTSWKSRDDPGSGNWTYWLDTNGPYQLILSEGQVRKWRSGPFDGFRWNGMPDVPIDFVSQGVLVNNSEENSAEWGTSNASIYTILCLDFTGNKESVKRWSWPGEGSGLTEIWSAPKDLCDSYQHCGPNGNCNPYVIGTFECECLPGFEPRSNDSWKVRVASAGCVRKRGVLGNICGEGDDFVPVQNAKVPDTTWSLVNMSFDINRCKQECLKDCSCTAYSSALGSKRVGCIIWHGDLNDTRVFAPGGQDLYVRVDAVEYALYAEKQNKGPSRKRKRSLAILITALGLGVGIILVIVTFFLLRKRKRKVPAGSYERPEDFETEEFDDNGRGQGLQLFDVNTIIAATDDFSLVNKLGVGGFGSVYMGQLANGQEIAVKRLSATSSQGIVEFKNEVRLISKLQHKNLVRLYGCCIHKSERMLVYEYLPNKSLDFFIFDESRRLLLDWRKRFEIIIGIARGLLYLHQDSRLKIIHRDLKPSNVLLDAVMNPKISDFGMTRIFGEDQTEANTNRVVGTFGYMSPEYAMEGSYSIKSDVFSFGVLVLEIISGMKNNNKFLGESTSPKLIGHVWDLWRDGRSMEIVDSSLAQSSPANEVLRCIQIGLLCVQESPEDRPSMSTAVFMLGNDTTALPSPMKPAFIFKRKLFESDSLSARTDSSINHVTVTEVEGR